MISLNIQQTARMLLGERRMRIDLMLIKYPENQRHKTPATVTLNFCRGPKRHDTRDSLTTQY